MRELLPSPKVFEVALLWKWIRYYVNNWRISANQTQSVLDALTQCYWRGLISWMDLHRCERLLPPVPRATASCDESAQALVFALSCIGTRVNTDYEIIDIAGFVDQGVVFQAKKNDHTVFLLALTTDSLMTEEILSRVSLVQKLSSSMVVGVEHVIETPTHVFLALPVSLGQPLSAWIFSKYPSGLPKRLARAFIQQLYALLVLMRDQSDLIASLHPGQLFIEPESLRLQWIPCASPTYYAIQPHLRSHLYQAPRLYAPTSDSALGYRLTAMAYELYTGCVPIAQQVPAVLAASRLSHEQKKRIRRCLGLQQPLSLTAAALLLDANQHYMKRDNALLALVSVFALAAITWQGLQQFPLALWQTTPAHTVVIAQEKADQHINLLKAAFFTQIEENNLAGAQMSWQALQQLLPSDDVFIETIGPQMLAKAKATINMAQNAGSMQIPEPFAPQPLPDEEVNQLEQNLVAVDAAIKALPPLPAMTKAEEIAPLIEAQLEAVVMTDPCQKALQSTNASCADSLSNKKSGPSLSAQALADNQTLLMTQQAISIADYNQYCGITQHCKPYQNKQALPKTESLDLELDEIETVLNDYNEFCRESGSCEPLDVPKEPVRNLTAKQIQAYAAWLTTETGFTYRLPTVAEWQSLGKNSDQWLLANNGQLITTLDLDSNSRPKDKKQLAFYLVREMKP